MKILIVGFGSIGRRHHEVLEENFDVESIDIVSAHINDSFLGVSFSNLDMVLDITKYDYFIISNETSKHFNSLLWLNERVSGKKILVEKPLFDKEEVSLILKNDVYVAYNLRYHPIMGYLHDYLLGKNVLFASLYAGQYLPEWRPSRDYRQSYSASLEKGGGVLRDLSHELDYAAWLFGSFELKGCINEKVSDLEIDSDDLFTGIAVTQKRVILNVTMDYISKMPIRRLFIHTDTETIDVDLIKNEIEVATSGNKESTLFEVEERNYTYCKMHEDILFGSGESACSYEQALDTVSIFQQSTFEARV